MIRAIYNEGYSHLEQFVQQELVKQDFPHCKTWAVIDFLYVDFVVRDPDYRLEYNLRIIYKSQRHHRVFVLTPKITTSVAIHMYPDGSLCLYDPPDISPFRRLLVGNDLIPMAALWVCHYEQWLINGNVWKGVRPRDMNSYCSD